jgi:uncharacterized membrane protein YraQ (UPF0718 family)
MEKFLTEILTKMVMEVIGSIIHNWLPLSLAIVIAAIMKVYIDSEKLKKVLLQKPNVSIWASVTVGAFTPLCACGTMAVIVGMLTTTLPWGPIMAFLTSSPLMSPEGFIMLAGVTSFNFAVGLTVSSIIIGLGSGYVTHVIEKKTNFLKNQTRFSKEDLPQTCGCNTDATPITMQSETCGCSSPAPIPVQTCGCGDPAPISKQSCCDNLQTVSQQTCCSNLQTVPTKNVGTHILDFIKKIKWRELGEVVINLGLKQIVLFYSIFIAIGYLITYFVPTSVIVNLFGVKNVTSVPLAALIGLPLYVTTESAIPLINSLMGHGASGGSMLAFMITGQATSAWVVAGIATFMKKRVISLYILFILFGGIFCGYLYDLILLNIK